MALIGAHSDVAMRQLHSREQQAAGGLRQHPHQHQHKRSRHSRLNVPMLVMMAAVMLLLAATSGLAAAAAAAAADGADQAPADELGELMMEGNEAELQDILAAEMQRMSERHAKYGTLEIKVQLEGPDGPTERLQVINPVNLEAAQELLHSFKEMLGVTDAEIDEVMNDLGKQHGMDMDDAPDEPAAKAVGMTVEGLTVLFRALVQKLEDGNEPPLPHADHPAHAKYVQARKLLRASSTGEVGMGEEHVTEEQVRAGLALLVEAAAAGHPTAIMEAVQYYWFPTVDMMQAGGPDALLGGLHPHVDRLHTLALSNDGEAQFLLALVSLSGIETGLGEQALTVPAAIKMLEQASSRGVLLAKLALGFRVGVGLDMPQSCHVAVNHLLGVAIPTIQAAQADGIDGILEPVLLEDTWVNADAASMLGNIQEHLEQHRQNAAAGDAYSTEVLGHTYFNGDPLAGVAKNYTVAHEHFVKAAELGSASAMTNLGVMYIHGLHVPQNATKAFELFEKAAELGDANAYTCMAYAFMRGEGVPVNLTRAVEYLEQAASHGVPAAEEKLGLVYMEGLGVAKNSTKARLHLEAAVDYGINMAAYNLGILYWRGAFGKESQCSLAYKYIKMVADRSRALEHVLYHPEIGLSLYTKQHYKEALRVYAVLSQLGMAVAQNNVAFMLQQELASGSAVGLTGSPKQAAKHFFDLSARQNDSIAMRNLADCYLSGWDGACDINGSLAVKYLHSAAEDQDADAAIQLGRMYAYGNEFVDRNLSLAWSLASRAENVSFFADWPALGLRASVLTSWLLHVHNATQAVEIMTDVWHACSNNATTDYVDEDMASFCHFALQSVLMAVSFASAGLLVLVLACALLKPGRPAHAMPQQPPN